MALSKQDMPIPFASGVNTKMDDKQLPSGQLAVLENAIFTSPQQIQKRNGYDLLHTKALDGSQIEGAKQLASYRKELLLFTDLDLYAYSQSIEKWINKGRIFTALPTTTSILRNNLTQYALDVVTLENLNVYTYQDTDGVHTSIMDTNNQNFILSDEIISEDGSEPRLARVQNNVYIFYRELNALKYRKINVIDPTSIGVETTVSSTMSSTSPKYDCVTIGTGIFIGYNNTSDQLSIMRINLDESTSSTVTLTAESPTDAINLETDSSNRLLVTYSTGAAVKFLIRSYNYTSAILVPTVIETIADASNVTCVEETMGSYRIIYEISAAETYNYYVKHKTITYLGVAGSVGILKRSVGLASKPWRYNDETYVTLLHNSDLQSTYFITDSNGNIVSQINQQVAGDFVGSPALPKVAQVADDQFLTVNQIRGRLVEQADTFYSLTGVNSTILDFDVVKLYQNDILGDNLHIVGGILRMYDGKNVVEHGFHVFPEGVAAGSTATTGGTIEDGEYQYSAVYAWTDNQGNVHRSAPSVGLTVTLSGGTTTQTQAITVPTLRLTNKTNIIIELYRTEASGTVFYKVSDSLTPTYNDPTVDTVSIVDTTGDTSLINNEILYTTGGLLENISAPSSFIIEQGNSRVFLGIDARTLQFSKLHGDGEPVEFNDTYLMSLDSFGGDLSGLKIMDDKLIVFKEDAIYYVSGDGPNNLGQQDNFTLPELISTDVGCVDKDSIVLTPVGLLFKSRKGIYMLSRSLSVDYIGAPVERFNGFSVTSAILMPEKNQVRFTTSESETLVYDYFINQWVTFTNHRALSAIFLNNDYYYLRPDGSVFIENVDSFADNGSSIKLHAETGWMSFAGIAGHQRVYSLMLLGTFKSPHKLKIKLAYDFNPTYTQEKIIDTADFTDNTRYGDYSPYGLPSTVPYGGADGNVYQIRLGLKKQQCESLKISIEDVQSEPGEGLALSNMSFRIGVKSGRFSINQGRTYGSNENE